MKYSFGLVIISAFFVTACSSSQPTREQPAWTGLPTRTIDNGYIVYIGSGESASANDAELAAEGMAIQDLANECTFIPKGTRVEDRYSVKQNYTYKAYAKVAVEFQTCDEASKTTDPTQIKNLASVPFTEELRKFEDSVQDHRDEVAEDAITGEGGGGASSGSAVHITSDTHYFIARQYVVYRNQEVILAPATAYAPGSPEAQAYAVQVRPVVREMQTYSAQNPQIVKNPPAWSSVAPRIRDERPRAFAHLHGMRAASGTGLVAHHNPPGKRPPPPQNSGKPRKRHFRQRGDDGRFH